MLTFTPQFPRATGVYVATLPTRILLARLPFKESSVQGRLLLSPNSLFPFLPAFQGSQAAHTVLKTPPWGVRLAGAQLTKLREANHSLPQPPTDPPPATLVFRISSLRPRVRRLPAGFSRPTAVHTACTVSGSLACSPSHCDLVGSQGLDEGCTPSQGREIPPSQANPVGPQCGASLPEETGSSVRYRTESRPAAERLRMAGGQMLTASQNPALVMRSRRERAGQMVQGTSKKVQPPGQWLPGGARRGADWEG